MKQITRFFFSWRWIDVIFDVFMPPKHNPKPFVVISFENASILRKFTILFLVASIIPMVFLCYLYIQHNRSGEINLTEMNFRIALALMASGVLVGYYSMRSLIAKVIQTTQKTRQALQQVLSPEDFQKLHDDENEITILNRSFSAVTQELKDNIQNLELAKKTLESVMSKVGQGISNMEKIDAFLNLILETVTHALNGKVSTILLINDEHSQLTLNTIYGARYDSQYPLQLKLFAGSPLLKIIQEKQPALVSGFFLENINTPESSKLFGETFLCAPLMYKDKVKGLLTLYKPSQNPEPFSQEDMNLVFHLACQTAVALENSRLNMDIEKTYFETISALALAVDAKDQYSRGHLERVSKYVLLIGKELGLDNEDLKTLRDGAQLHDLGKIGIPDDILLKTSPLIEDEWAVMRRHPEIGESIIKPVRSLSNLCDLIRHHHEKLDGTGYPDGLKGEDISPLVRILTVADIYDALTTERSYRPKKTKLEAARILRSMKEEIDQDIVEVLLTALETSAHKK